MIHNTLNHPRVKILLNFVTDEDVTFKEGIRHIYHWYLAETYYIKQSRARRNHLKHAAMIRDDLRVLRFRKDLKNHL